MTLKHLSVWGADRLGTSRLAEQAKKKEVELDEEV